MSIRRYRLGDHIDLEVQTTNNSRVATTPDACPTVDIYSSGGTKVISAKGIPILDRYGVTGLFAFPLLADSNFSTGFYTARYKWAASGFNGVKLGTFWIIPGGDNKGQYTSMTYLDKPYAKFLVGQTDSSDVIRMRNPKF